MPFLMKSRTLLAATVAVCAAAALPNAAGAAIVGDWTTQIDGSSTHSLRVTDPSGQTNDIRVTMSGQQILIEDFSQPITEQSAYCSQWGSYSVICTASESVALEVFARSGNDRIAVFNDTTAVPRSVNIDAGYGDDRVQGGSGREHILGGEGHDELHGLAGNDFLAGMAGNDIISGGQGDDKLYGDAGNDHLFGDVGNDCLHGGSGLDYFAGEDGNDTLVAADGIREQVWGGSGYDRAALDSSDLRNNVEFVSGTVAC